MIQDSSGRQSLLHSVAMAPMDSSSLLKGCPMAAPCLHEGDMEDRVATHRKGWHLDIRLATLGSMVQVASMMTTAITIILVRMPMIAIMIILLPTAIVSGEVCWTSQGQRWVSVCPCAHISCWFPSTAVKVDQSECEIFARSHA